MAVTYAPVSASAAKHIFELPFAMGGVDMQTASYGTEESKARVLRNFLCSDGVVSSRRKLKKFHATQTFAGSLHSHIDFCNVSLLHIGSGLVSFDGTSFTVKYTGLPDKQSLPVCFAGKVYMYCDGRIFSVDSTLAVTEEMPYCPLYSQSVGATGEYLSTVSDFSPNMASRTVSAKYMQDNVTTYTFPVNMDTSRKFRIKVDDVYLESTDYTVSGNRFTLTDTSIGSTHTVYIEYFLTENAEVGGDFLKDCTLVTAFGGGTLDGSRVIASGNASKKGMYFVSEPQNPLKFLEEKSNILGEGTKNITAFQQHDDALLMFTDSGVYRMNYVFDSDNGGYFTVKPLASAVGCVSGKSTVNVDGRTVFASRDGVYIVDRADLYDRTGIAHISFNIEGRTEGYLAETDVNKAQSAAVMFENKYYLKVGTRIYICDFADKGYVSSSDRMKAEKALMWYVFTDMPAGELLHIGGQLCIPVYQNGVTTVYVFADDGTTACEYTYRSGDMTLGYAHIQKKVSALCMDVYGGGGAKVGVTCYADGKAYFDGEFALREDDGDVCRLNIKMPPQLCERFAVGITTDKANVGFRYMRLDYITVNGK